MIARQLGIDEKCYIETRRKEKQEDIQSSQADVPG